MVLVSCAHSPPGSLRPPAQTLGSTLVAVSFLLLLVKVFANKSVAGAARRGGRAAAGRGVRCAPPRPLCAGISLKTLEAYAAVFALRLTSILMYEGYLPFDKSGDWFYQATEVLSLAEVAVLLVAVLYL